MRNNLANARKVRQNFPTLKLQPMQFKNGEAWAERLEWGTKDATLLAEKNYDEIETTAKSLQESKAISVDGVAHLSHFFRGLSSAKREDFPRLRARIGEWRGAAAIQPSPACGSRYVDKHRLRCSLNSAQRLPTLYVQHGSQAQNEAHRDSDGSLIIQRSVPAIVSFEVWQAAQVTMHRNAVARPDLTKRKYLLRGLMKCALCGSTYIGSTRTDSPKKGMRGTVESVCESGNGSGSEIGNGFQRARPSHEPVASEVEIQDGQVLRPYYLCNGHQHVKSTGAKCPSAHLRALDIEAMLWNEVEGFLRHPEEVLGELAAKLKQTFEGAGALQVEEELEVMRQEKAAVDDGRASLFRLFRRGAMSEEDLDRQLGEMVEEENALGQKIERLEREVAKARDSNAMLRGARELLERLEQKLDASLVREPIHLPAPAPSWEVRRRIVEEIVLGVAINCHIDPDGLRGQNFTSTLHVSYIFEPRDLATLRTPQAANGSASGLTLQRVHTVTSRTQARKSDWQRWVRKVLQEEPTARLSDIIERVEQRQGVRLSRAAISRIRADLGLAPDNAQSRAAKSKFKGNVELSD